jgi:RNA polymerase sigma-70 factor (ECF subfamily)
VPSNAFSQEPAEIFVAARAEDSESFRVAVAGALADLARGAARAIVHLKLWEDMTFAKSPIRSAFLKTPPASRYRYALRQTSHAIASHL